MSEVRDGMYTVFGDVLRELQAGRDAALARAEALREAARKAIGLIEEGPPHESLTNAQVILMDALRETHE